MTWFGLHTLVFIFYSGSWICIQSSSFYYVRLKYMYLYAISYKVDDLNLGLVVHLEFHIALHIILLLSVSNCVFHWGRHHLCRATLKKKMQSHACPIISLPVTSDAWMNGSHVDFNLKRLLVDFRLNYQKYWDLIFL